MAATSSGEGVAATDDGGRAARMASGTVGIGQPPGSVGMEELEGSSMHRSGALMRVSFVPLVVVPFAIFAFIARLGAHPLDSRASELDKVFTTAAALAILPIATLFWLRARHQLRGNLSAALGLVGLALLGLGAGELVPLFSAGDAPVDFGSGRTTALLLVFVVLAPAIALDVRVGWAPVAILAGVLVIVSLAWLSIEGTRGDASWAPLMGWGVLAVALTASYLRTTETTYLWLAIILLGFLVSELARHAPAGSDGVWTLAIGVARTTAIMIALLGLLVDLDHSEWRRRQELKQARERYSALAGLANATLRTAQERDHKARSALGAMEYMIQAMKRRGARIDPAQLTQLEVSMTAEIALLRRLVTIPEVESSVGPFSVADAVVGVVEAARERGLSIDTAIPGSLVAMGVPGATAEIVQNLLDNALKHAPGSPVSIGAVEVGPYVILSVVDQGPGVPTAKHGQIFQRGRDGGHSTSAQGRGLGLYISAQLAAEMGGHLWVEDVPGGGASFRLALDSLLRVEDQDNVDSGAAMPGLAMPPLLNGTGHGQTSEGGWGGGRAVT